MYMLPAWHLVLLTGLSNEWVSGHPYPRTGLKNTKTSAAFSPSWILQTQEYKKREESGEVQ